LITVPGLPHAFPYHDPAGFAELILAGRPGNAARRVGQEPAAPQDEPADLDEPLNPA
jgi:hypothetical protein